MILNKIITKYYSTRANKTFLPPFGLDYPGNSFVTAQDWNNHSIQDYTYSFNSWAFRGDDYSQYIGKPVNICLGDSFTLNIGGPIEHSWPSQLSKHFDIPTLNLGIDGAGNDTIAMIYNWAIETFDVKHTFVMYSFFHRRYDNVNKLLLGHSEDLPNDNENIKYFENHKIKNSYFTFLPQWCWSEEEFEYINNYYAKHTVVTNTNDLLPTASILENSRFLIDKNQYNIFRGADWPSYTQFVNGIDLSADLYNEIVNLPVVDKLTSLRKVFSNRDGFHLNKDANEMVCNYFLKQLCCTPAI